ncbi:hypothetical protein [Paucilactobacillus kaifaensis]|uniref:hypothetical protein n=1 Tax=Paucilactobacillus kaifaensis TaxID=2559921 RepID=UPI0010F80FC5|nr:hypothetical protein [Paucilactobacillus kaifaensis]
MDSTQQQLDRWAWPIALGVSGVAGFLLGRLLGADHLNSSDILNLIKHSFLKEGPIEGSWIESNKVPFQRFAFKTDAYRGGISRYEDNKLVSYEFLADTKTGTVLSLKRI